jgi:hypothetical protein
MNTENQGQQQIRNLEQKLVNLKEKIAKEKTKSLLRDRKLSC